jgi:hypothetical protein
MQQNNQNMTGFQNSMRKNSWQEPKSLYEMKGKKMSGYGVGGDSRLDAFDRRDMEEEPARQREREALSAMLERPKGRDGKPLMKDGKPVLSDVEDRAVEAHQNWLASGGTGHPEDSIGKEELRGILRDHSRWRDLGETGIETVIDKFREHLRAIHDSHMSTLDQDEVDMTTDALQKQNRYESYDRLSDVYRPKTK